MTQPETLEISTVASCKNACDYCPQHLLIQAYNRTGARPAAKMSFDTFRTCVDKLPHGAWVDFSAFVEPFLNPRCADMILYAHQKKHPMRVFTTVAGMSREDVDKIKHIDFLRFSLHLPDRPGLMKVNVDDRYRDVLDYLLTQIPAPDAMCFGPLHPGLEDIVRARSLKVKTRPLNNKALGTRGNNIVINTSSLQLSPYPPLKGRVFCKPIFNKNNGPHGRFNHNVLLPNGDVVLCCSDYGLEHKLGNLLTGEYGDLFHSGQYREIMRGLEDESIHILCRTCEHAINI